MLPLFAYVVIRSQIPNCFSEFRFVEDFLNSSLCKGEVHYFLVTYCTSLALISYLRDETLDKWFEPANKTEQELNDPENSPKRVKKRGRTSSLIEVQLEVPEQKPIESDFLSWATSLIRK